MESILNFLIPAAMAQQAGAPGGAEMGLMNLLFPIILIAAFYFLLIRPQTKRAKEHKQMVEALKKGKLVARAGWNGKGMWLFIIQGSNDIAKLHGYGFGEMANEPTFRDAIFMKTVDNQLVPWTASQTDVLADDWLIVE